MKNISKNILGLGIASIGILMLRLLLRHFG